MSAIRLRRLLVEDNPAIQGYQAVYAERLVYNTRDIAPALEASKPQSHHSSTAGKNDRRRLAAQRDLQRKRRLAQKSGWAITPAHAHDHAGQIRRLREAM